MPRQNRVNPLGEIVAVSDRVLFMGNRGCLHDAHGRIVSAHLAAMEERAKLAELDRVRAEGERAIAEAKITEEANTRREAEARLAEKRKRRRVRFLLAGAVLMAVVLAGFGVALTSLWREAESAKERLEFANGQLADEKQQTEAARKEAERQREIADVGRVQEGRLRLIADKSRDDAIGLKGLAEKAQASEVEARKKLEVFEYGRTIQVAHQEWRDNNISGALALLASTKSDLRGWEWHYIHRLCNASILTCSVETCFSYVLPRA